MVILASLLIIISYEKDIYALPVRPVLHDGSPVIECPGV